MSANQPEPAQLALVAPPHEQRKRGRRKTGRHERAFELAVKESGLDKVKVMAGSVSLGRALACGLDAAELSTKSNGYELSQLAREYWAYLRGMGLAPSDVPDTGVAEPLSFGGPE